MSLAIATLLAAAPLTAVQEKPASFPSGTQVVVLDVVATGEKGRPLDDLRSAELQVTEDGKPCEILSLRLVRAEGDARPRSTPDARGGAAAPPAPTTPARASLVVLVFDRLTTRHAPLARKGALDLLEHPYPADTWFAVFKVHYGVHLLASFTTDRAQVRAAVERATAGDPHGPGRPFLPLPPPAGSSTTQQAGPQRVEIPDLQSLTKQLVESQLTTAEVQSAASNEGLDSLYAIQGVAEALQQVQGRKAIVYFAEGYNLPTQLRSRYDDAVSAANRANAAVHTVDVRGLTVHKPAALTHMDSVLDQFTVDHREGPGSGATTPGLEAGGGGAQGTAGDGPVAPGLNRIIGREEALRGFTLERLADDTGGLAVASTNDLGAGLVRVAQELRQYYEIVYAPANPVLDGRFRRIRVKASRGGVHLRTRSGYFATPAGSPRLSAHELPLIAALAEPSPLSAFPLRSDVLHFAPEGGERECVVLAEVPLADVQLDADEKQGVFRAHLSLLGYVKDERGDVVARLSHDWPIEGALAQRDAARAQPAVFRRVMPLAAGRYTLELVVQDRNSGRTSVKRTPFEVPPAGPAFSLGSLTVLRSLGTAGPGSPADDPLRVADATLSPALGAPFVIGSSPALPVYVPVYPGTGREAVAVSLELRRGGQTVGNWTSRLSEADATGRIPWLGGVPAGLLQPGRHELVATARRGLDVAAERAVVDVLPDPAAPPAAAPVPAAAAGQPTGEPGSAPTASAAAKLDPVLARTLQRAARYVEEYEERFRNVVAEEEYSQQSRVSVHGKVDRSTVATGQSWTETTVYQRRRTRADLVFVRLAGDIPWGQFRDVFEINGTQVRDRDERLQKLFSNPSPVALEQARRIMAESARYNIGSAARTLNVPTLPLLFLHARNQARFSFEPGKSRRVEGFDCVEVRFRENARPTLVRDGADGDLPATGRFWIDPQRGTVLRSEVVFRFEPALATGSIETDYRRDPKLRLFVPTAMKEHYEDLRGSHRSVFANPTHAEARYSNFRQFTVTTDETAALPPDLPLPE